MVILGLHMLRFWLGIISLYSDGKVRVGYSKAEVGFILGMCHPPNFNI